MITEDKPISPKPSRRGAAKSSAVIDRLRNQIVRDLKPTARLATFSEMEEAFNVSRTVLRVAVEELKRDGFIHAVDRQGLFVSEHPPHLSHFGLVFPNNPTSSDWPRFFTALQQEAIGLQQERGTISFGSYFDLLRGAETESFARLREDVAAHRVAGLLVMPGCESLLEDPTEDSVPKMFICGKRELGCLPSVATDNLQLCDRMAQWLNECGRTRIAVVAMGDNSAVQRAHLERSGVPYRPHWVHAVGRDNLPEVRKIVTLLMDYPADQRPDGLIVLDDNLTEHAVGALLDCGLRIGQDIDVIAHCNWPWPVANSSPIQRVGFHARHVLMLALRGIERLRHGESLAADMVHVPALFETEIDEPWQATAFDPR